MASEDFWKNIINGMNVEFPTEGVEAPTREVTEVTVNDTEVEVLHLTFDMYLLNPTEDNGKVYMVQGNQRMETFGKMGLKEAMNVVKRNRRKT